MKWIILYVVLIVMICETYCHPAKIDPTDEKGKTNKISKRSTLQNNDDNLLEVLLASKLKWKENNDHDSTDDTDNDKDNRVPEPLQQMGNTINVNKNNNKKDDDDDDDDDDEMATMLGILAMQSEANNFDKNINSQFLRRIFCRDSTTRTIANYCRKHLKSYLCRNETCLCRQILNNLKSRFRTRFC